MAKPYAQNPERDSLLKLIPVKKDDTTKVDLYRDIGITYIYENPPASIPYFNKAIDLAMKLNFTAGLERSYAVKALAYVFHGKYDSSLKYVDLAILYANKVGDIGRLALVYLNRADVYENLERFGEALKDCDTAMAYAQKSGNKDRLARIYDIMSGVYMAQKKYPLSLEYLDKAIVLYKEIDNQQMLALAGWSKAYIYKETGRKEEAIALINNSIRIAEQIGDIQNLSTYYGELAANYFSQKKYNEAELYAKKALQYAVSTGHRVQESVIHDLFAQLYRAQNNFSKAIPSALNAYQILNEEKSLAREKGAAQLLAELYEKTGDTKQAYKYLKISSSLNDSLLKQQFSTETANLQTTFQVAEKENEIQLLNKDKELQKQKLSRQRLLMLSAVLLAALAIAGIVLLINRNRLRLQMKELKLRNQIAADLHDEVGSSLSSIHMLSQIANKKQDNADASQKEILNRMSVNAKETMDKMGDIVWMIKPGESEDSSLKNRMERFAREICSNKNISLEMELGKLENVKLSMQQRKNIYLIFKEALNNAAKYSGTDKIIINVSEQNKQLQFSIKDFGKGFDISVVKKGNGLHNLQNRAKELNGKLGIESEPGNGTAVNLSIPV
ncbi:MAG: tetratricopeptide repeat protein [Ferruginibacter sp.]